MLCGSESEQAAGDDGSEVLARTTVLVVSMCVQRIRNLDLVDSFSMGRRRDEFVISLVDFFFYYI